MSATARITLDLAVRPAAGPLVMSVPAGTPAGAVWGHLDRALAAGGPPDGVRYVLNGLRTIPGAPLRDGDHLLVAPPTD